MTDIEAPTVDEKKTKSPVAMAFRTSELIRLHNKNKTLLTLAKSHLDMMTDLLADLPPKHRTIVCFESREFQLQQITRLYLIEEITLDEMEKICELIPKVATVRECRERLLSEIDNLNKQCAKLIGMGI